MTDEHILLTGDNSSNTTTHGSLVGAQTIPLNDLGRYQIISKLGNGAHGMVMKARDLIDNKFVAIKFIYLQGDTPYHIQNFEKAVKAFNRETEPHIS